MSLYKTIDLTEIDRDQFSIEIEITDDEMLEEISIYDVIQHFGEDELLWEMDYDSTFCFSNQEDMVEMVLSDPQGYGIQVHDFKYHNEQNVYERVVDLLQKEKINYSVWEEFLTQYED